MVLVEFRGKAPEKERRQLVGNISYLVAELLGIKSGDMTRCSSLVPPGEWPPDVEFISRYDHYIIIRCEKTKERGDRKLEIAERVKWTVEATLGCDKNDVPSRKVGVWLVFEDGCWVG